MSLETLNGDAAAGSDSFDPATPDETTPEKEGPSAAVSGAPETLPETATAQYEPPAEALVDPADTSTPPVALRPCPAGPEPHRLDGRE
jgi:hypothetical protein